MVTACWLDNGQATVQNQANAKLQNLNNVDIVLTKDKSKWSRCIVVETANTYFTDLGLTTGGGSRNMERRNVPSVTNDDNDNDGLPDIVEQVVPPTTLATGLPVQYAVYLGQPDGTFRLTNTYEPYAGVMGGPSSMGDVNGDGNLDIIAVQNPPKTDSSARVSFAYFQVLAGNGDGTFTPTFHF